MSDPTRPVFHPSDAVRASFSDDGLVLLDLEGGLVLSSNPVGARIWQLLAEGSAPDDIARRIADEYAAPFDRVHQDVWAFVSALRTRGLLDEVNA